MNVNGFARSLVFALFAAGAVVPWLVLAGPLLGRSLALELYLVAAAAVYLAGLAPDVRRRLGVLCVAAAIGLGIAAATRSLTEQAIGLAALVAVVRSVFLHPAPAVRAVVVEIALTGAGLLFARFLAGPSAAGVMLAIWGFFLVQGLFFLLAGIRGRGTARPRPDPFEEARRRALALLDAP